MSANATRRGGYVAPILLGILVLALALRLAGLAFGLPLPHARPDENHVAYPATKILQGEWRPGSFAYPALLPVLNAGIRDLLMHFGWGSSLDRPIDELDPEAYWISRVISVAAGVLTVLLTFQIGRRIASAGEGLVAAFLLAVTHLHCRDSHFGVTDVTMTLGTTTALWLILRTDSMASLWRFALCGGAIGLAASAKYPAFIAFAPLIVAAFAPHATAPIPAAATTGRRIRRGLVALLIAGAAALVVFLAINPFAAIEPDRLLDDLRREFSDKTDGSAAGGARGWIEHARFTLWLGLGAPYAIAALLGCIVMAARRRRGESLLLVFALAYYVGMGSGTRTFARYMLPLTPLAALFAARAIASTAQSVPDRLRAAAMVLATAAVASVSFCRVVATDRLLAARDTRLQTYDYLKATVPSDERVLWIGRFTAPPTQRSDPRFIVRDALQVRARLGEQSDPADAFAKARVRWVVCSDYWITGRFEQAAAILPLLADSFVETRAFSPLADGLALADLEPSFDRHDIFYVPYAGFAGFERAGPVMRILQRKK